MSEKSCRAKSLIDDVLFDSLSRTLGIRFLSAFKRKINGENILFRFQQIKIISDLFFEINNENISQSVLQEIFQIRQNQVERDIILCEKSLSPSKKKTALTQEQEMGVLNFIHDQYTSYNPCSPIEIIQFASSLIEKELTDGWLQSFMSRYQDNITTVTALPMDESRTEVTLDLIDEYFEILQEQAIDIPASLVFNIDETGFSSKAMSKNYNSIIPMEFSSSPCYFKVLKNEKNITAVVCISLDGDLLPTGIVLPRTTIPVDIESVGIRDGKDAVLMCSDTGYMNTKLFYSYLSEIIIPKIIKRRIKKNLEQSPALILMDNCSSHINESINILCQTHNIKLITYPPHTSHLLQPLDLLLFGLAKMKQHSFTIYEGYPDIVQRVSDIINSIQRAGISNNIRSSFRRAGIEQNTEEYPPTIRINQELISQRMQGQLLQKDIVVRQNQDNPVKRRKQKYGFINSLHFQLLNIDICPYCFSVINEDDEEYIPEEKTENDLQEEELFEEQ